MRFNCSICKKQHDFSNTIDFGLPLELLDEIYNDQLEQESTDRWMIVAKNYFFIKGIVTIPLLDTEENFYLLVWIMLEKKEFSDFISEISKLSNPIFCTGNGILYAEIPYYNKDLKEPIMYEFTDIDQYPVIKPFNIKSKLGQLISKGMTTKKAVEFFEAVYHCNQ